MREENEEGSQMKQVWHVGPVSTSKQLPDLWPGADPGATSQRNGISVLGNI